MTKPKSIVFQLRFVDLLNKPFPNLYHEIRESGKLISVNTSNAQGLGTPISRPPGTILVVHVRHPLTKKMIKVSSYINVPTKKGTINLKASFSIQTIKLRRLHENIGQYSRQTYKVLKGDTLYSIANKFETKWQILAQLNKDKVKEVDQILPGQWLKIPPKNSGLTGKINDKPDSLNSQTHYKVKKDETLSGISQRSGISVDELKRINGITDPKTLQTGQKIKLRGSSSADPQTKFKPITTANPKPTSSSNEKEEGFFDSAKDAISDAMSGGKNDRPVGKAPTTNSNSNPSSIPGSYTVKSGDTLSGIAKRHYINTNELARANGLKLTDTIHPDDRLEIPKGGSNHSTTGNSTQSHGANSPVSVTTRPSNSSDGTPKEVATTNGACICKAHDLIWGKKFNCSERLKVIEICQNLWPNNYLKTANNLMAVFAWESGEKFETGAPNQRNSGGTGLIQIIPSTYKDLTNEEPILETVENYWGHGKTLNRIKQLANMTVIEYLDFVEKYFEPIKNKDLEFIDFYLQVLFPVSSGKPEYVVFAKDLSKLDLPNEKQSRKMARVAGYPNNRMDTDGDERVMKSEITQSVKHYIIDGKKYKSFGTCEKFNIIEKPVPNNIYCPSNIEGCFCKKNKKLPMQSGFLSHVRIKKHHTPKLERRDYTQQIKKIILHRTVNSSAQSTFNSFNRGLKPYGTHFVVDKDGEIYQTANLNKLTIHAGNANPYSVGIEVVGMPLDKNGKSTLGPPNGNKVHSWQKLTVEQTQSVACLTRYLLIHYGLTQSDIAVHEDVAAKTEGEGRTVLNAIKEYL